MVSPVHGRPLDTSVTEIGGKNVKTKKPASETGAFLGELSYVRFGSGPENLVILPGITLENKSPSRFAAWTYRLGFASFAEEHTVYVISRRRSMPPGYTTRDMATDYARAMEDELGPSRVMAFSTGGSIAQYLALDRPELIEKLVLVVSASRLSEEGRETCERWRKLAQGRRWRELRADMAAVNVTSELNKRLARAFMAVFGRFVLGTPSGTSDFLTTLRADIDHDTTALLPELSAPTLVIGGSEDPFFPGDLLRETAGKIPGAELRVYERIGHGVPKERKRRYEDDALAFLGERSASA
jgi:pimeloyl-ACP methyl ester carboxylesterase